MSDPRYPIGPMPIHLSLTPQEREEALGAIRALTLKRFSQ